MTLAGVLTVVDVRRMLTRPAASIRATLERRVAVGVGVAALDAECREAGRLGLGRARTRSYAVDLTEETAALSAARDDVNLSEKKLFVYS